MDLTQILLLVIVGVLSLVFIVLGIQVFFILNAIKSVISRVNKVLGDAGVITESISKPVVSLSAILSGVKIGSLLSSFLSDKKKHKEED